MMHVTEVRAWEVLDSRGFPTVEAEVCLDGGYTGSALVPAGASKGSHEAVELRDGDRRWLGKGVRKAVENIRYIIAPALKGLNADIREIDEVLLEMDGSPDKSRLGANAILAVSIASCKAISHARRMPLYRYIMEVAGASALTIPTPMVNMISGGLHASWNLDIQDLLIIPLGARSFRQALDDVGAVYHTLRNLLSGKGFSTLLADEGGFSPRCGGCEEAIELLLAAVEECGLALGRDVALAMDIAATHLLRDGRYMLRNEGLYLSSEEMVDYLSELCERYGIISLEDGCAEDDLDGWRILTDRLGDKMQLVGDDLFATSLTRLKMGAERHIANSALIKPNQAGTVTETIDAIKLCKELGYTPIVSARSGDTEDSFIADLAVGASVTQIKIGSISRSERTSKYNRLLRIEDELVGVASYHGGAALRLGHSPTR
ncbi:MAG: phosphopyruvate hydratase [Nitrososphaerota archaeon]